MADLAALLALLRVAHHTKLEDVRLLTEQGRAFLDAVERIVGGPVAVARHSGPTTFVDDQPITPTPATCPRWRHDGTCGGRILPRPSTLAACGAWFNVCIACGTSYGAATTIEIAAEQRRRALAALRPVEPPAPYVDRYDGRVLSVEEAERLGVQAQPRHRELIYYAALADESFTEDELEAFARQHAQAREPNAG